MPSLNDSTLLSTHQRQPVCPKGATTMTLWSAELEERLATIELRLAMLERADEDQAWSANAGMIAMQSTIGKKQQSARQSQLVSEAPSCTVEASVWDVSMLIGMPVLGSFGSALAIGLLVCNCTVQVLLVAIWWYNFGTAQIGESTSDAAWQWRVQIGHSSKYYDKDRDASLVAMLCSKDKSLSVSALQFGLWSDVDDYLQLEEEGFKLLLVGKVLCVLALICFYLVLSKEVHDVLNMVLAMFSMPIGCDSVMRDATGCYAIMSMSRRRVIFVALICIIRLMICFGLLYSGTYSLVYTIDIQELLLNAVALELIITIDELMFAGLATEPAKLLIARLTPLKMGNWPQWHGIDIKSGCMAILLPILVVIVYASSISGLVSDLVSVAGNLCGGNRDFVWHLNSRQMAVMKATTPQVSDGSRASGTTVVQRAIHEAIEQTNHAGRAYSKFVIWANRSETLGFEAELKELQPNCSDMLQGPFLQYLREAASNESIMDCSDVKDLCTEISLLPGWTPNNGRGVLARMACPLTCGCASPASGLFVTTGCPEKCTKNFAEFDEAVEALSCDEMSRTVLQGSAEWRSWMQQLHDYGEALNDPDHIAVKVARDMQAYGCQAFRSNLVKCSWESWQLPFKSPAALCPRSCLCDDHSNAKTLTSCPRQEKCLNDCFTVDGDACTFQNTSYTRCTNIGNGDVANLFTAQPPWCPTLICEHDCCVINGTEFIEYTGCTEFWNAENNTMECDYEWHGCEDWVWGFYLDERAYVWTQMRGTILRTGQCASPCAEHADEPLWAFR